MGCDSDGDDSIKSKNHVGMIIWGGKDAKFYKTALVFLTRQNRIQF
jgi:hypothetical protein